MPSDSIDEIAGLEALVRELATADAEFEHHLRRYGDQLERTGSDWGIADDINRLKKNRKRIAKERKEISARLDELRRQQTET